MDKAVLHDHLDGGLRGTTALELAKKASYNPLLNVDDINKFFDRSDCVSLEDYLEAFIHTTALMNTYENLERIAYEAAEDMHNNGINLYESRYAPLYSVSANLSIKSVLEAINSGFKQAESMYGIKSGLILCGMRNDKKNVEKVGSIAIDYKNLIIGFDIAGPELNYRPSLFKNTFNKLKEAGVNITIHAGEGDNVDSIQDALDNGAQRIGHGVRIIEDIDIINNQIGKTAEYILNNQIPLEICITSNIHTNMYKNYTEHPVKNLIDYGFNISINTDNRLMSNTDIKKELLHCSDMGINNPEELLNKSARYSFLN
ncbi:MAG: adenosine deaminase family protein [Candidatus Actinomarinales bacterium]|nr:MAG: adenosine deaminase family protein [Candidatus Actinomarinales bacterium]